jgi:hypothetical protein
MSPLTRSSIATAPIPAWRHHAERRANAPGRTPAHADRFLARSLSDVHRGRGEAAGNTRRTMTLSRLALAAVLALRAVLVYGEATSAASAQLTWGDLLPARVRLPRPRLAPAAPRPELIREVPS